MICTFDITDKQLNKPSDIFYLNLVTLWWLIGHTSKQGKLYTVLKHYLNNFKK